MIHNLSLCRLKKSKHNFFIQLKKPNKPKKPPKPTAVRRQTPARVNVKNPTNTKHLTLNRSKYTVCVCRVYREAYKYKQEIKGSEHQLCSQRMYRSRLTKLISSGMKSHGDSELSLPSVPSFISPSSSSRGRTSRWCQSLVFFKKLLFCASLHLRHLKLGRHRFLQQKTQQHVYGFRSFNPQTVEASTLEQTHGLRAPENHLYHILQKDRFRKDLHPFDSTLEYRLQAVPLLHGHTGNFVFLLKLLELTSLKFAPFADSARRAELDPLVVLVPRDPCFTFSSSQNVSTAGQWSSAWT